jgi:hypothetical protein
MRRTRPLPRPIAVVIMLGLLLVMPATLYVAVRVGAQPAADVLARQFGGTAAVLLPHRLVEWLAVVGALVGAAADLDMLSAPRPAARQAALTRPRRQQRAVP